MTVQIEMPTRRPNADRVASLLSRQIGEGTPTMLGGQGLASTESFPNHPWAFPRSLRLDPSTPWSSASSVIVRHARDRARLRQLSQTDPLTGQSAVRRVAEEELARALRYRHPLTLAVLDVNAFKGFNDSYGHAPGQRVAPDGLGDAVLPAQHRPHRLDWRGQVRAGHGRTSPGG